MSPHDANATLAYIAALFPKSAWAPEMGALFLERIKSVHISLEQAKAVVGQYRCEHRFHSPDIGRVILAMRNCEARPSVAFTAPPTDTRDPPITGYEIELVHRWRANKEDPVFDRLEKRHRRGGTLEAFRERFRRAMARV